MLIVDTKKEIVTLIVLFSVILGSFFLYQQHKTKVIAAEVTGQLTAIQDELRERYDRVDYQIKRLAEEVDAKTHKVQQEISQQNKALSSDLTSQVSTLQKETTTRLMDITGQLNRVESEREKTLEEFGKQLKQVSASSGDSSTTIQAAMKSVVSVETMAGKASGTIIRDDGYIVTSKHVVNDARAVVVELYSTSAMNRQRKTARVVGANDVYDLAVLKIDTENKPLAPIPVADSKKVKLGEKAFALGNPGAIGFTATEGIISATDRYVGNIPYFQTDSPINIGNSGGPLINRRGEMVGLNTLKIAGYEGISLALPSNIVSGVVNGIVKNDEKK